jgi:hypothetical protein
MHRSSFRSKSKTGVNGGGVVLPPMDFPMAKDRVTHDTVTHALAHYRRVESAVEEQTKAFKRIEESLASICEHLKDRNASQFADLKSSLVAIGGALKSHIDAVSGDFLGAKDLKARLGDQDASLARIVSKLYLDGARAEKKAGSGEEILKQLAEIVSRLDSQAPEFTGEGPKQIMAYIRAEKKVIRDSDGNIVGWKTAVPGAE